MPRIFAKDHDIYMTYYLKTGKVIKLIVYY